MTRPRVNNNVVAAAISSVSQARADLIAQADLAALYERGGPVYTLTGYTASIPSDDTVVGNYATVEAFEAAVHPSYEGERARLAGYPFPAAIAKLEAVALFDVRVIDGATVMPGVTVVT